MHHFLCQVAMFGASPRARYCPKYRSGVHPSINSGCGVVRPPSATHPAAPPRSEHHSSCVVHGRRRRGTVRISVKLSARVVHALVKPRDQQHYRPAAQPRAGYGWPGCAGWRRGAAPGAGGPPLAPVLVSAILTVAFSVAYMPRRRLIFCSHLTLLRPAFSCFCQLSRVP